MSILEIAISQDRNARELTLYECLHYFSIQECHDPRDKFYGLLGLVKEGQRPDVAYKKSVEQVFPGCLEGNSLGRLANYYRFLRRQSLPDQPPYGAREAQRGHHIITVVSQALLRELAVRSRVRL
jgi:hypothetical protein